jgi:hypothetical protein
MFTQVPGCLDKLALTQNASEAQSKTPIKYIIQNKIGVNFMEDSYSLPISSILN